MSKSLPVAIADPDEYVAIFIAGISYLPCPLLTAPTVLHYRLSASLVITDDEWEIVIFSLS